MRIALGIEYDGGAFCGWQTQPAGCAAQDKLESALSQIAGERVATVCAGRTDAGVHALAQVVHFDTVAERPVTAWVRGSNALLPSALAVTWAKVMSDQFHARYSAHERCYRYVLLNRPVRPAADRERVGWVHLPLGLDKMRTRSPSADRRARFQRVSFERMPGALAGQTSAPAGAPETRPVPVPQPPVAVATPASARAADVGEYAPVKRGETLSKIAASVKPEGVSLEQMLVGILRNNPDAFMNNNMNRLKAGKMLRIPDKDQLIAMPQSDAVKEVRVQVTDWNRYRRKVADTAGTVSERKAAASPRDKVSVKDKTADGKPVLRLSSGEPPGGAKGRSKADRVQALEEELIARERALNEANQRIKELERAVKETAK